MERQELIKFIEQKYRVKGDTLKVKEFDFVVFCHEAVNGVAAQFAILMDVPASRFQLSHHGLISLLSLKTTADALPKLCEIKGIFPAKQIDQPDWITIQLDQVSKALIGQLLDHSVQLTAPAPQASQAEAMYYPV